MLVGPICSPYRCITGIKEGATLSWCNSYRSLVSKPLKYLIRTFNLCIRPCAQKSYELYIDRHGVAPVFPELRAHLWKWDVNMKREIAVKYLNDFLDKCWGNAHKSLKHVLNLDPEPFISSEILCKISSVHFSGDKVCSVTDFSEGPQHTMLKHKCFRFWAALHFEDREKIFFETDINLVNIYRSFKIKVKYYRI